jgi:hypothetical protein
MLTPAFSPRVSQAAGCAKRAPRYAEVTLWRGAQRFRAVVPVRLPVLVVGALAALTVILALTPTAASARSTGAFYDASNADVWNDLTQLDKDAVENFESVIGRGDYTPWTAADVGGSRVPEDVAGELVRHFRSSIPTSAPGAEAAQSEVSAALQETGMWPRIWQGLGLGARGVATRVATRAIPALAGGFVLWDIGCAAGVGLPLCHHEHVRLTHEQVATIRFRFSGSGVGSDALCLPSAASNVLTQPPSSGVCPDQKLYRAPLSGTVVAQQPKMAPNVLDVEWASTNASGWKGVSGCWPGPPTGPAADYTYTYFSPSSVSGAPFGQCNPVVEPSGESFQHLEGLNYGGQAYAETQCGQNAQGTPCWTTSYHTMVRGWYLDPGTTRTLEAPTTGTDPTWPGDGTATPTRLASDMPARPERGGTTATKIGQALHDHPALRKEIVYVLNRQQPEDEPSWGVTTVDDGPAVGRATVPDCTGVAYDTCVSMLHAFGITSVVRQTLSPDTVDLDRPARAVTIVTPQPGTQIDPGSQTVTVTTNPDAADMPQPSQRQIDLATALDAQNATVDDTNKYDIARSCLDLEDAAGNNGDEDCKTLPTFITGNDAREAADHDLAALGARSDPDMTGQAVNPAWVMLSRDAPGKPGAGWYSGSAPCTLPTPAGQNCDEYPFFSTQQGGGDVFPTPNLKYIDGTQNQLQGTRLNQFYTDPTCSISTGSAFLAIPLPPGIPINTTWACNAN